MSSPAIDFTKDALDGHFNLVTADAGGAVKMNKDWTLVVYPARRRPRPLRQPRSRRAAPRAEQWVRDHVHA